MKKIKCNSSDKENILIKENDSNSTRKGNIAIGKVLNNKICGKDESIIKNLKHERNMENKILKRIPLKDINIPLQKFLKNIEYKKEHVKNENEDFKSCLGKESIKHSQSPEDIKLLESYSYVTSQVSSSSKLSTITRDSLPLALKRLNIYNIPDDAKPEDSNSEDTFLKAHTCTEPDFKHVTAERNYDILLIDDSFVDSFSHFDESLFFDESDNLSDDNPKVANKEQRKINSKKELECMVLKVPKSDHFTCTPANTHGVPEFKDIKKIRRNNVILSKTKDNENAGVFLNPKPCNSILKDSNLYYNTLLSKLKKKHIFASGSQESLPANRNIFSPIDYVDKKQQIINRYDTAFYKVPGAVYLDNQENVVFHQVLYSTTYLKFIVKYLLQKELKYQLTSEFLKKFTITDFNRSIVINWLIKLQTYMRAEHILVHTATYMRAEHILVHTAVRIMDRTIDSVNIPLNKLQLVALASFWIALKYHAVNQKEITWMVNQTGGAYTSEELSEMELKVFQANKFDVDSIDSSTLIHYYVLNLELSNSNIIAQCAHYLLDCALLNSRFVRTLPSMMAAGAVFTSLHLMKQYDEKLWVKLCFHCGYYPSDELKTVKHNLLEVLKEVNNPSFPCREPYYKYCSSRYCGVSHIILDALMNNF